MAFLPNVVYLSILPQSAWLPSNRVSVILPSTFGVKTTFFSSCLYLVESEKERMGHQTASCFVKVLQAIDCAQSKDIILKNGLDILTPYFREAV